MTPLGLLIWIAAAYGGYRIGAAMKRGSLSTLNAIQLCIVLMLSLLILDAIKITS